MGWGKIFCLVSYLVRLYKELWEIIRIEREAGIVNVEVFMTGFQSIPPPLRVIRTHISFCKKMPAFTEFHGFEGSISAMSYLLSSCRYQITFSQLSCSSQSRSHWHQTTYLDKDLVQLHERNRLSQTLEAPVPENQVVVALHFVQLGLWDMEPASRAEDIRVRTKNIGAAMDGPSGDATCSSQLGFVVETWH